MNGLGRGWAPSSLGPGLLLVEETEGALNIKGPVHGNRVIFLGHFSQLKLPLSMRFL